MTAITTVARIPGDVTVRTEVPTGPVVAADPARSDVPR